MIAKDCKVNLLGAHFDDVVTLVESIGFEITRIKELGLSDLFEHLAENKPVVVALGAWHLPYSKTRVTHAVVICRLQGNKVIFINPAPGKETKLESLSFPKA